MKLLYKNEKPLFVILLLISLVVWLGLLFVTRGLVLVYVLAFYIFYVFAQSGFISYLKGTGVEISVEQFPDLHNKIISSCDKLGMKKIPDAYLMHMGGAFNAFATRFLGRNFVVLYSDIVDALEEHPDALNFYIGHEIGHLKQKHLIWGPVLAPATWIPVLGTAYARAKEYSCDRHGLAACSDSTSAQFGLAALAAGGKRWRTMNQAGYVAQTKYSSGFWMSLHELISDYPWLTKRVAEVRAQTNGEDAKQPRRSILAWIISLFIPRIGVVNAGSGLINVMIVVAVIGILAAVAVPAYQEYTAKAQLSTAVNVGRKAATAVGKFYEQTQTVPESLEKAGFVMPQQNTFAQSIDVNPTNGIVTLSLSIPRYVGKNIIFTPSLDAEKHIQWECSSEDIKANLLPPDCR